MAWQLLAELGFLGADYVYHRWFDAPPAPKPASNISIPRTDIGGIYPVVYGRARVNAPVLAGVDTCAFSDLTLSDGDVFVYSINAVFVIGIPFYDGIGWLNAIWIGDSAAQDAGSSVPNMAFLHGEGNYEDIAPDSRTVAIQTNGGAGPPTSGTVDAVGNGYCGYVEYLNGNPTQELVDPTTFASKTRAGDVLLASAVGSQIPGFRCFALLTLHGTLAVEAPPNAFTPTNIITTNGFSLGINPAMPSISVDISSYPNVSFRFGDQAALGIVNGQDANPIDVLFDLLTQPQKLGIDSSLIHVDSFSAAASTLAAESNGFSRSWEDGSTAADLVAEIMQQIDGVIYEDPTDGLIHVKLVRNDYDPASCLLVDPSNCSGFDNFAMGGWTDTPSKIRITFSDRLKQYQPGAGVAQNLSNAFNVNDTGRELEINMPGVTEQGLADNLADRELLAQSRPLMKGTANVNRTFYATVPGDVVMLNWPEYGISRVPMRVAASHRGTTTDGTIKLDLIQDYFYVYRNNPPVMPPVRSPIGGGEA